MKISILNSFVSLVLGRKPSLTAFVTAALAFICALGLEPGKANATVILSGCTGGNFGDDCSLAELGAGGNFTINDKLFTHWDPSSETLNAAVIRVDPIDDLLNPGFMLTDTGDTLSVEDGEVSITELLFDVIVQGGPLRVKDIELIVEFGEVVEGEEDNSVNAFARVSEFVFDETGDDLIAEKHVFCEDSTCANTTLSDSAVFAPQSLVEVFTRIEVVALGTGAPTDEAEINKVTYKFSQISKEVPEPTTLLLVGSGLAGLGLVRWRRKRFKG